MRINREEIIVVDEFDLETDLDRGLEGVLQFANEFDGSDMIFVRIGKVQLGFIPIDKLVDVAKKIIELWNPTKITEEVKT